MGGKSSKGNDKGAASPKAAKAEKKPAAPKPEKEKKVATPKPEKKAATPKPEKKPAANPAAELTAETLNVLKSNTHFNEDQIVAIHKEFLKDCPSGKLNKKDFVKMFKALHPLESKKAKADNYCDYVFKAFDRDNDSVINFQEFVVAFSITSFGDLKEKAEFAFNVFDLNRDKKIDKNEMLKVVESLYDLSGIPDANRKGDNAPKARVEKLMLELDLDKDKVLSFDEFVNGVTQNEAIKEFLVDPLFHNN